MKSFLTILFFTLCFQISGHATSIVYSSPENTKLETGNPNPLSAYPVQLTTQLTAPFSGYLSDYASPGNENLKLLLYLTDFSKPIYDIKLQVKIEGQGITIQSKTSYYSNAFSLVPGQPLLIGGADLAGLLNTNNLQFSNQKSKEDYEKRKVLPEGNYSICFTAYDYNNPLPIQVSNESCAYAWMMLSDPPYLNAPVCGTNIPISDPQTIFFSWTPVNMSSPNSAANTEYEFSLYEVRPAEQEPNNIIQTQLPVYTTTVTTAFFNYGITETPLIPGMQYVWRVRAIDVTGRDLFKNNGFSQVCTFYWGTKYDGMNNISIYLTATPLTHRSAKLSWDSIPIFSIYHLEYRKTGGNWSWMPVNTANTKTRVFDLEPETEYEARVLGKTNDGYTGQWSNTAVFKTPPAAIINCEDVSPPPNTQNFQPLTSAYLGMIWQIGQFEIQITSLQNLQSTEGKYTGTGKVKDAFVGIDVDAAFKDVTVNEQHIVVAGNIDALTQGVEKWSHQWDVSEAEKTPIVAEGVIDSIYVEGNRVCVISHGGGQPVCTELPENTNVVVVRDSLGNQYTVTLIPKPAKIEGPTNYFKPSADSLAINDSTMIIFSPSATQKFGFDKKEYTAFIPEYELIKIGKNGNYFVPYKSIGKNEEDEVVANIQIKNFDPAQLSFKTKNEIILSAEKNKSSSTQYTVKVPYDAGAVYAWYNNKKIGKLTVVSLPALTKKVVIVPVNGVSINTSSIQKELNELYKQANVNWELSTAKNFDFELGSDGLEAADANLMTKYSTEMRALRDAYKEADTSYNKKAYYLFAVNNFSDAAIQGYMVRGRALGFIKADASSITIAHELAHGAFGLEHTFPAVKKSSTNNLMDYNQGANLIKKQWAEIHSFLPVFNWMDGEEGGSYETDGHYWTVYFTCILLKMEPTLAEKLAYYSELPDTEMKDNMAKLTNTWADGDKQELLHSLTNSDCEEERIATKYIITLIKKDDLEFLGAMLHRFGDTFAHCKNDQSNKTYGEKTWKSKIIGLLINYNPDFTLEHAFAKDPNGENMGTSPDIIGLNAYKYLNYVKQLSIIIGTKFGLKYDSLNFGVFKKLAKYAQQKTTNNRSFSLIGIINYELAKEMGGNQFYIAYAQGNDILSKMIMDIVAHKQHIANTLEYLTQIENIPANKISQTPKYKTIIIPKEISFNKLDQMTIIPEHEEKIYLGVEIKITY